MNLELNILEHISSDLLESPASGLFRYLPGPSLIHIPGRKTQPLFISVLQHGNEDTGWEAVRRLLKKYLTQDGLARAVSLFIGNVNAAQERMRHLDDQPDFNRCWPGGELADTPYHRMFAEVVEHMQARQPFAAIDIHNNTGLNPHYVGINRLDDRFLKLASMFANKVVYFTMPKGTQANAFANLCPSATLECGQAGNVHGTDYSQAFLEACLQLDNIDDIPLTEAVNLYEMVATVRVNEQARFAFDGSDVDIRFINNLDYLNFQEIPSGTEFASLNTSLLKPVTAVDQNGQDITSRFFDFSNNRVITRRPVMPSMLTLDKRVIRQDCLCYLMERIPTPHSSEQLDPVYYEQAGR